MTSRHRTAFGAVPAVPSPATNGAEIERAENEGMPVQNVSPPPDMPPVSRNSDESSLERRVLAHARILQTLIAHMAETEPRFMERLQDVFIEPLKLVRHEREFADTADFAAEFIRAIVLIGSQNRFDAARAGAMANPASREPPGQPTETAPVVFFNPTLFQIHQQGETWELQVDGYVHGNYPREADALKAAATAATRIAARGQTRVATDVLPGA